MDLSKFIPKDDTITIDLEVRGQKLLKDDGTQMTITVYLPHSAQYKAVTHEQTNKRIQRLAKGKKAQPYTAQELEEMTIDLLVKTTKDWNIQLNGKSPKFTEAAAAEVYAKLPWLQSVVTEAQQEYMDALGN